VPTREIGESVIALKMTDEYCEEWPAVIRAVGSDSAHGEPRADKVIADKTCMVVSCSPNKLLPRKHIYHNSNDKTVFVFQNVLLRSETSLNPPFREVLGGKSIC
jgi:hypothetical protein